MRCSQDKRTQPIVFAIGEDARPIGRPDTPSDSNFIFEGAERGMDEPLRGLEKAIAMEGCVGYASARGFWLGLPPCILQTGGYAGWPST